MRGGLALLALGVVGACADDGVVAVKTPANVVVTPAIVAAPRAPESDDGELPGLEPHVVTSVVGEHQTAVSGCHVVEYSGQGAHSGSVTLTWSITPSGHVRDVEIAQTSFENASFHECLVSVIAGLEFPTAPGSTEVGGWRFRFRSRGN
jgi:hypothetical protein